MTENLQLAVNIKDSGIRFILSKVREKILRELKYTFGYSDSHFGEIVYNRTYSRVMENGQQESWPDTVLRVINGLFTIRKWWFALHNLPWEEEAAQDRALSMATSMLQMKWLPPGRGLFVLGTDYIYERGSASLYNCSYTNIDHLSRDLSWLMDFLMVGSGVGFGSTKTDFELFMPLEDTEEFVIPDTREGWVESIRLLLESYEKPARSTIHFNYDLLRPYGSPINGFGGTASGPAPLILLHTRMTETIKQYIWENIDATRLVSDLANQIGVCVVAGNVRRSAQINLGSPNDHTFINLKNYEMFPDRMSYGWMSNNSVKLEGKNDFLKLTEIAERIRDNGEPGILNMLNIQKYGRYGDELYGGDEAIGINPCSEIPLENKEVCVGGSTWLISENSIDRIQDLEGQKTKIWNGEKWSEVEVKKTGTNLPLLRVTFGDGTYLDTTRYHRFSVRDRFNKYYKEVKAEDLMGHSKYSIHTEPFSMENQSTQIYEDSYSLGVFMGDGCVEDNGKLMLFLFGEKLMLPVIGHRTEPYMKEGYNVPVGHVIIQHDSDFVRALKYDHDGLKALFSWDRKSVLNFFAGWIDTDGSNTENNAIRLYISNRTRAELAQLLLTKQGIKSSLCLMAKKGDVTNYGIRSEDIWYLSIMDGTEINCHRINTSDTCSAKYKGKWQVIRSVEEIPGLHDVYCFEEIETHKAVFNNTLTYQCNLSEVFPSKCSSRKEFLAAIEDATFYSSTISLYPTHSPETNAVVAKNRRIGVSLSGIAEWVDTWGMARCTRWLKEGYKLVRETNAKVNREAGIPPSIRVSTIKPSGTISQLAGVPSGMHFPTFQYAIRRIIIDDGSPIAKILKLAGYIHEPAVEFLTKQEAEGRSYFRKYEQFSPSADVAPYESSTSVVFECPIEQGQARPAQEVSAWEQFALLGLLQREWADNSVSCTIYFSEEEAHQIPQMLTSFVPVIKSVSMLPHSKNGRYPQMPYEGISKEEYEVRIASLRPLDWSSLNNSDGNQFAELYCSSDRCFLPV